MAPRQRCRLHRPAAAATGAACRAALREQLPCIHGWTKPAPSGTIAGATCWIRGAPFRQVSSSAAAKRCRGRSRNEGTFYVVAHAVHRQGDGDCASFNTLMTRGNAREMCCLANLINEAAGLNLSRARVCFGRPRRLRLMDRSPHKHACHTDAVRAWGEAIYAPPCPATDNCVCASVLAYAIGCSQPQLRRCPTNTHTVDCHRRNASSMRIGNTRDARRRRCCTWDSGAQWRPLPP